MVSLALDKRLKTGREVSLALFEENQQSSS